jgi:hypothetical protein
VIALALSLITSRIAGPIASVVAVVALGLAVGQCSGRVKAESNLQKMQSARDAAVTSLKTCQGNVEGLNNAIDAQNAAVEAMKREGDAKVAESAKAARSARAAADSLRRDADRILGGKVGADACASADAIILGEVG